MKKKNENKKNEESDFIAQYIEKQFNSLIPKLENSKKEKESLIPTTEKTEKKQYFA